MKNFILFLLLLVFTTVLVAQELNVLMQIQYPDNQPEYAKFGSGLINSAYNRGGDINNDGYDDFLFQLMQGSETNFGYSYGTWFGGEEIYPDADVINYYDFGTYCGIRVQWQGDYDGDGLDDYLQSHSWDAATTTLIRFSSDSTELTLNFPSCGNYQQFCAGDLNGDGCDDIIAFDWGLFDGLGHVWVLLGGDPMDNVIDLSFEGVCEPENNNWYMIGQYVFTSDYNGDGFVDLFYSNGTISGPSMNDYNILPGGSNFGSTSIQVSVPFTEGATNGDFNGDGYDDIAYVENDSLYVSWGNSDFDFETSVVQIDDYDPNHYCEVCFYCNINNDQYDDLVIKYRELDYFEIYLGGPVLTGEYAYRVDTIPIPMNSGGNVRGMDLGDMNNDGYNDILMVDGGDCLTATIYTLNPNSINEQIQPAVVAVNNYPNPFSVNTTFTIETKDKLQDAKLEIFNIKGQVINRISLNNHEASWDGTDLNNKSAASGIYLYRVVADGYSSPLQKIVRIKE